VLERQGVAGYVYGISSTFYIYFETDEEAVGQARRRRPDSALAQIDRSELLAACRPPPVSPPSFPSCGPGRRSA